MKAGVVSGLRRETRCFQSIPAAKREFETFAGVGPDKAALGARDLVAKGARGLMSFGVAGGLSVTAKAGTVVLASTVIAGTDEYATSEEWRGRVQALIGGDFPTIQAPLAGSDRMVPTPHDKQQLHEETGATACDMESHAVARVAQEMNVPFVVVRAISDPAERAVPTWVLRCMTPEGDVRTGALLWQAARRPGTWGNLVGLAGESRKAFASLRGVARRLGPGLGLGPL